MQRLKSDEEFIDQLVDMFATDREKHFLSKAKNNGKEFNVNRPEIST